MSTEGCGIAGLGSYLPEKVVDAWAAVKDSGISRERFDQIGVAKLHLAADGEFPSDMAVTAARRAMADAAVSPEEIDLIIYCGSVKDHGRWQAGAKVQAELECWDCFVFDMYQGANGQNLALNLAQAMIADDPEVKTVLITAAERWDTTLPRPVLGSSFIFGDGGSAAVVRQNHSALSIATFAATTQGAYHDTMCVPEVGASARLTPEVLDRGGHWFQFCRPPEADRITRENSHQIVTSLFAKVLKDFGADLSEIGFVITLNDSQHRNQLILKSLGLDHQASSCDYLAETGMLGTADLFYNLKKARDQGRLKPKKLVALSTATGGHSWVVTLLRM